MSVASGKGRRKGAGGKSPDPTRVRGLLRGDGIQTRLKRPSSIEDLYGGGYGGNLLLGEYGRGEVYAWLQKRHSKGRNFLDDRGNFNVNGHSWHVPYGVRMALQSPLSHSQLVNRYPFYVTWVSPKTGKRLKKYFMSMAHAIAFIAEKAQYVDSDASIVARHGIDIPPKLRGKLPRKKDGKMFYWCPCCMTERRFRRTGEEFFAMRKEWNDTKARYEMKDRKLALLACTVCGITNRDHKWRRSNQPWETRKIKKGVRRVKRTRRRR